MSKKDYELIAGVFAVSLPTPSDEAFYYRKALIANMADALARTNPLFNRKRFIEACK